MKYRKKPVVIDAFRFMGTSGDGLDPIPDNVRWNNHSWEVYDRLHDTWVKFEVGDYIVTGIQGETYPCKPDVFEQTYERVK